MTTRFSNVLNAFRHQRSSDRPIAPPRSSGECAQRLSASKKFGPHQREPSSLLLSCAQRLSASKKFGHSGDGRSSDWNSVLNAFRHQRSSDLNLSVAPVDSARVLNAFRHQRSSDSVRNHNNCLIELRAQRLSASKKFGPCCG